MKIDETLIDRLAVLSKLEFSSSDKAEIQKNLNNILKLVEKLQEVNTEGVEPLVYMNDDIDVFREDQVIETISKQEALKNAPSKDSDYIKVPKVISK